MRARLETDDTRLQRLADLSIKVRMLKARVQAALEEHKSGGLTSVSDSKILTFRGPLNSASCPYCGHTAGLALVPREYRLSTTPVRCFACQRDSSAGEWVIAAPQVTSTRRPGGTFSPRGSR